MPAHATATAMHFPANAGLIFLTDELTNDRYLVDTGATLSIIPCASSTSPSGPLLKGTYGLPILSWGFIKNCSVSRQIFYFQFVQAAVAGPFLDIDFFRKFRITVAPDTSQIIFACIAAAQPAAKPSLPSFFQLTAGPFALPGTKPLLPKSLAKGSQVDVSV
jgi:hypothetical protein